MPPALRSSQTSLSAGGVGEVVTMPTPIEAGDLLVALVCFNNDTGSPTDGPDGPVGWHPALIVDSSNAAMSLWYGFRIADGTEDGTTYTWYHNQAHDQTGTTASVVGCFSGVTDQAGMFENDVIIHPPALSGSNPDSYYGESGGVQWHRYVNTGAATIDSPDLVTLPPVLCSSELVLAGFYLEENLGTPIGVPSGFTLVATADHSAATNPDQFTTLAYRVDGPQDLTGLEFTYDSGTAPSAGWTLVSGTFRQGRWVVDEVF